MGGICKKEFKERGLWFEIKCLEDIINSPTAKEQDKELARNLSRHYKKLSEGDYQKAIVHS